MTEQQIEDRLYFEARLALIDRPEVRLFNRQRSTGQLAVCADVDGELIPTAILATPEIYDRGPDRIRERAQDLSRFIRTGDHRPPGTPRGQGTVGACEYWTRDRAGA